ncbi:uncharacterized protein N0V89_008271 [Didymosphaeria variabile]|uniref:Uncharacterized protein n=1 Tax=Didymosphaeria variabile TaxID=1932322 RepID=A0A9W9C8E3_9PLEO|nr:uncharacterized protein N0V89_008271 [Didymosphaeria variabile]KAJ4349654.1 hypothetical protein N0V89_008271 [Didymosphaeria variabile]
MTERVTRPRPRAKREVKTSPVVCAKSENEASPNDKVLVKNEPGTPDHPSSKSALPVASPSSRKPSMLDQVQRKELATRDAIAQIQRHYRLPALYQPSKAVPDALDMAFISHFVHQNNATRKYTPEVPWITSLPDVHGTASKPAVRLSIRAASMAFYAAVHRDTTILVDSYRWYTMSLNCQRQSLARLPANTIPDAEEILVPIILSIYEAYAGTTTTSMWPHMAAAAKIVELRGPTNCTGITSTLFKIMRVSDVSQAKSAHQEIADIMLLIPETIAMLEVVPGSLRRFFNQPLPFGAVAEPVVARIHEWLRFLDEWAIRFPYLTKAPIGEIVVTTDMTNLSAGVNVTTNGELTLPNSFVAFTAASYQALRLILFLLLHKVMPKMAPSPLPVFTTSPTYPSPPSGSSPAIPRIDETSLLDTATIAAQNVLDIAKYQETTHQIGGFDVLRTVFPLVIVGNLSPGQKEKDRAVDTLTKWGHQRGITGLCTAWLNV